MFQKLEAVKEKYDKLSLFLSDPEIISNQTKYQKYAKEQAEISKIVEKYIEFKKIIKELKENEKLLKEEVNDEELKELAKTEIEELETKKEKVEDALKILLIPKDPNDGKNIFLEIRAGTGGEEAGLFVADMFRVYTKYAEKHKWRIEIMTSNPTGVGGFKEIIALIEGKGAYSRLKFESGVHRVQRVPATEAGGRIHTSAITIAILPEAEEVEVDIDPNDLRIDVYRSSGPGGQSVNTTDSAVRIIHIPTGIGVSCQDEKSQHKNKSKALRILRARLLDKFQAEQQAQISQDRKKQVGSGDRSGRIRTYNFPQGRVTDHRIGLTLYKLETILGGELDGIIDPLITHYQTEILKEI